MHYHHGYDCYRGYEPVGYGVGSGYGCGSGFGYGFPYAYGSCYGYNHWFALIVVLFILLIIIGATCYGTPK
jgi:uncharacterized protein (TIGR01732 family)